MDSSPDSGCWIVIATEVKQRDATLAAETGLERGCWIVFASDAKQLDIS
ncbi:MAG: hypothetical protein H7Y42_09410 [Chitinophagaceae bacterium]|nr:hypothetical protein [Chitinophagaceae bacterium]